MPDPRTALRESVRRQKLWRDAMKAKSEELEATPPPPAAAETEQSSRPVEERQTETGETA
jgi:hypothetical protein